MKRVIASFFLLFFIISCTHFEASDAIYPEVNIVGTTVGLKYKIGPFEIIDSLEGLDGSIYNYIVSHKNETNWSLKIVYDNSGNEQTKFQYFINDVHVMTNYDVLKRDVLLMERNRLPNWVCVEGDCQASEKPEEKVEEKPKKTVDKPAPIQNKKPQGEKRL